jgi:DNA-binding IscR family transcriptional regulator
MLVRSFRGSHGGYALARAPEDISVIDVLTCLGGPVELDEGPWNDNVLAAPVKNAALAVSQALEVSLADLVWNKIKSRTGLTYQI